MRVHLARKCNEQKMQKAENVKSYQKNYTPSTSFKSVTPKPLPKCVDSKRTHWLS